PRTKCTKRRSGISRETNFISARLFQEQAGQNKQRIRNRAGLDLRNHIFEYALPRKKTNRSAERLWRSLSNAVRRTAIFSRIGIAMPGASFFGILPRWRLSGLDVGGCVSCRRSREP